MPTTFASARRGSDMKEYYCVSWANADGFDQIYFGVFAPEEADVIRSTLERFAELGAITEARVYEIRTSVLRFDQMKETITDMIG